jgi:alpha-2-macroglobulin
MKHIAFKPGFTFYLIILLILSCILGIKAEVNDTVRVLSAVPSGITESIDQVNSVVVIFDKPMVPLSGIPQGAGSGPLEIYPPTEGTYRWLGTNTVVFTPSDTLPYGTAYTVRIPSGTTAIDGSILDASYEWEFETPRPIVIESSPRHEGVNIRTDQSMYLRFNQPIDLEEAGRFITIRENDNSKRADVPFSVHHPDMNDPNIGHGVSDSSGILLLKPQRTLKKSTAYAVELKAGLPGMGGPLGMLATKLITFRTHDTFRLLEFQAKRNHNPDDPLLFRFSNNVRFDEFIQSIRFSPRVVFPEYYQWWNYSTRDIYLNLPLLPETTYTVIIDSSLTDYYGQKLGASVSYEFTTGSLSPRIYMTSGQGLLEAYSDLNYPVTVRNIDSLYIRIAHIQPDSIVSLLTRRDLYYGDLPETYLHSSYYEARRIPKRPNVQHVYPISFKEIAGVGEPGVHLLEVTATSIKHLFNSRSRAFLQITELGLSAKFSPENNVVWVTRLRTAEPVKGARIEVRDDENRILWNGSTDENGLAVTPGWGPLGLESTEYWRQPRMWIFVFHNGDFAYTRTEDGTGIEPWRFNVAYNWNPQYDELDGSIFTERGIYRTGEDVLIKGIIRKRSGDSWIIPDTDDTVIVRIRDPRNDIIHRDTVLLSDYGSFNKTIRIAATAPTGYYSIEALAKSSGENYYRDDTEDLGAFRVFGSGSFRVQAFRPAEFEVTVFSPSEEMLPGDTLSAFVSARYLFGAPMMNDFVSWSAIVQPASYTPSGYDAFSFTDDRSMWDDFDSMRRSRTYANGESHLDENGTLTVNIPTRPGELTGPHRVTLEASVRSLSRRVVSGRASVTLHGGLYYIGIKRSTTFSSVDDTLRYSLATVSPSGVTVSGQEIRVKIIKRQWNSVRKAGVGGRYGWVTERIDSVYEEFSFTSLDSIEEKFYVPRHSGLYFITAEGTDYNGNIIRSGSYFYVSGSGYVAWRRSDDDRIDLVADAEKYKPGDIARIIVQSPYEEAQALITIERDGILRQWTQILTGSAPEIAIPLSDEYLPNVYASVLLLHGRIEASTGPEEAEDVGRPSFKMGYINLQVDPGIKSLKVNVTTDREVYRPGDSVTVSIAVHDIGGMGIPSEVTVSVADMGVLNLIGYELPDPFDRFYGSRALAVVTTQSLSHLVEQRSYGEKGEDEGGGGGVESLGDMGVRGDFRFTAYWNPSVRTDTKGTAVVQFKLPDNLTQFKVMAVAQTRDSEFGMAVSTFRVNKELLLQPALPRFVRMGDEFEGGIVATNFTEKAGTVRVESTVSGSVGIPGKTLSAFSLKPGESREVRFGYKATGTGHAEFTFRAAMNGYTDAVTLSIPVDVPRMKESVALYERTETGITQHINVPDDIYTDIGDIEFTFSSTALGGLERSAEYLLTYPYACLEQQLSRILPIITGERMIKAFNLPVLRDRDSRAFVQDIIDRISEYQTVNGGFVLWRAGRWDSPYVSAYALYTLARAKENGYAVNDVLLQNGITYAQNFLRSDRRDLDNPYSVQARLASQALMIYALSLLGVPEPAYAEQLYRRRADLPLFAKAFLFNTLWLNESPEQMRKTMYDEFMNSIQVSSVTAHFEEPVEQGLEWVYSSNVRTTAIVFESLLKTEMDMSISERIARWLTDRQNNGRWASTQENVYVLLALASYFDKYEKTTPSFEATIRQAHEILLRETFEGYDLRTVRAAKDIGIFPAGRILPVSVEVKGEGALYYGIRMNYYPKSDSLARHEGMTVIKTIESLDNSGEEGQMFTAGKVYKVTITLITPFDRYFVAVDDPLPAGFEPVNLSFRTETLGLRESLRREDPNRYWWGGFTHSEQYDTRVLLFADMLYGGVHSYSYLVRATSYGTFVMPATHAEQMYEPDIFGRTATSVITVR